VDGMHSCRTRKKERSAITATKDASEEQHAQNASYERHSKKHPSARAHRLCVQARARPRSITASIHGFYHRIGLTKEADEERNEHHHPGLQTLP